MIRTVAVAIFLGLCTLLVLPWLVIWSLLAGDPGFMYRCAGMAIRASNRIAGIQVHTQGLENIPPYPCIFASNHASNVDPPILVSVIPRRVAVLVKKELFLIPIFSRAMRVSNFLEVDRGTKEAATSARLAVSSLKAGNSFLMFPEGSRSPDGRLQPFKRGVATIAMEADVPIIPVSVAGTQKVLQKGRWVLRPSVVTIRFGIPVETSSSSPARRAELLQRVESAVSWGLPPDQQPLSSASPASDP